MKRRRSRGLTKAGAIRLICDVAAQTMEADIDNGSGWIDTTRRGRRRSDKDYALIVDTIREIATRLRSLGRKRWNGILP